MVRPCLDYCSPVWSPRPSNFQEIDLLEQTQRSFTKKIKGIEGLDYAQCLKKLHMYSIQQRSERFKIIYMYKIKETLVPNVSNKHKLSFRMNNRVCCVCDIPSIRPRSRVRRARDNSFTWTACNLWNLFPRCVRDIAGEDVMSFKNKLDKALALYPDVPRCSESGHTYI